MTDPLFLARFDSIPPAVPALDWPALLLLALLMGLLVALL